YHAATAVENQVRRLDVTVDHVVVVENGQRLGRLSQPAENGGHRQSRPALGVEQATEVDPVDPIEHEYVAAVVEQIVASVRESGVWWQREKRAGFHQDVARTVGAATHLERDETVMADVDGLDDARFATSSEDLERLVPASDTAVSQRILGCRQG